MIRRLVLAPLAWCAAHRPVVLALTTVLAWLAVLAQRHPVVAALVALWLGVALFALALCQAAARGDRARVVARGRYRRGVLVERSLLAAEVRRAS